MAVARPSGPIAAMVKLYAVEGCSSSLVPQVPSGPVCPLTVSPWASTSVTRRNVPDDTLTVTGASGRTSTARSAGETSSTAAVVRWVEMAVGGPVSYTHLTLPTI